VITLARSRKPVNPASENDLDRMKFEVASELGITDRVRSTGWSTMTSADCGRVGGQMVRRMIEQYESSLSGASGVSSTMTTGSTTGVSSTMTTGSTLTAKYDANNQP